MRFLIVCHEGNVLSVHSAGAHRLPPSPRLQPPSTFVYHPAPLRQVYPFHHHHGRLLHFQHVRSSQPQLSHTADAPDAALGSRRLFPLPSSPAVPPTIRHGWRFRR